MKYSNLKAILFPALLSTACAFVISCQSRPELKPPMESAMGKNAVRATTSDLTIFAEGSEWSGREAVKAHVTPLKVEIRNGADHPVRVQYKEFALLTAAGQRFEALPMFEIDGSVQKPRAVSYSRAPYQSRFYYRDFYAAPYYHSVYPGMKPYPYAYDYAMHDYAGAFSYWKEIELPTQEMQESALPEGVLEPGGQVRGHLFFEKVPANIGSVDLQFKPMNAKTGDAMGAVELPLRVVE